ncbi:MAG: type II secretion system minor pseudopilin GspH [Burkholderiales bacterium]|nr:type II secretion system minor pseudopilin GspH [Burkholderiales bacterium]
MSGFTLIEILVVLAIVAIAAGVAIAVLDGNDSERAVREARRFAGALEHAAARAQVRAETLGVSADGSAWRFWRRDEGGRWQPVGDDDVLATHSLPEPLRLAATTYSGRAIEPGAILPLRPTGRNEPFTFELAARDGALMLAADPLNRVSVSKASP